eukprot:5945870-Pyramimonas_sp.AAC.1
MGNVISNGYTRRTSRIREGRVFFSRVSCSVRAGGLSVRGAGLWRGLRLAHRASGSKRRGQVHFAEADDRRPVAHGGRGEPAHAPHHRQVPPALRRGARQQRDGERWSPSSTIHYPPLSTTLHYPPLPSTTIHSVEVLDNHEMVSDGAPPLLSTTLHYPLPSTTLHYCPLRRGARQPRDGERWSPSSTTHYPPLSTSLHYYPLRRGARQPRDGER